MTRREWLHHSVLVSAAWSMGSATGAAGRPASIALDHLLLGAPDLDEAVAWVRGATGVEPAAGGAHPGMGTRNALMSLGERQYLEIIAPDPAQSQMTFHLDLRSLDRPRLVTWAASTPDVNAVAAAAREAGLKVSGPRDGSRTRPDGTVLRWRTAGVLTDLGTAAVDPVPFFIQWDAGSTHPSGDSPAGCRLSVLELRHPDPDRLRRTLAALGLEADVLRSPGPGVAAVLATPRGELRLSS